MSKRTTAMISKAFQCFFIQFSTRVHQVSFTIYWAKGFWESDRARPLKAFETSDQISSEIS